MVGAGRDSTGVISVMLVRLCKCASTASISRNASVDVGDQRAEEALRGHLLLRLHGAQFRSGAHLSTRRGLCRSEPMLDDMGG